MPIITTIRGNIRPNSGRPFNPMAASTGGTITELGGYRIHTFVTGSRSGQTFTFNPSASANIEYLVVAGGGAGGGALSGGGGAGGMRTGTASVTAQAYSIVIGNGGDTAGSPGKYGTTNDRGKNGGNSSAFGITSTGGGGGAAYTGAQWNTFDSGRVGSSGGSGGGGGGAEPANYTGGGGGGAGGAGQNGTGPNIIANTGGTASPSGQGFPGGNGSSGSGSGGAGGIGLQSSISGTATYYGGGGGGGNCCTGTFGTGGPGDGGDGGQGSGTRGVDGANGFGGGGGGSGHQDVLPNGTFGGSGIVIVRYPYS